MSALDDLRAALSQANDLFSASTLGSSGAMAKVADDLEGSFGQGRAPDPDVVLKVLRSFVATKRLDGYRDIKNVCYGLLTPIQGGRSLASDPESTTRVLTIVNQFQSEPKKLKRCFQALLFAYLELDGSKAAEHDACSPKSSKHAQWLALRQSLAAWLPSPYRWSIPAP